MGDPGNELIIVKKGSIAIFAPREGEPAKGEAIRLFKAGDLLGEMALIDSKPRSLSARAEADSEILTLSAIKFKELLLRNPEMGLSVMAGLNDRIRYTTDFLSEVSIWVRRISNGEYATATPTETAYKDPNLSNLAAEFAQMAAQVKAREDTLKKEVAQLRVEIDDARRKQEVKSITNSDYYHQLKEKMKAIREQKSTDK
jgi:CRP-like cAMP-binding protein